MCRCPVQPVFVEILFIVGCNEHGLQKYFDVAVLWTTFSANFKIHCVSVAITLLLRIPLVFPLNILKTTRDQIHLLASSPRMEALILLSNLKCGEQNVPYK